MAKIVRFRVNDGIAAVTLDNPPYNIITAEMREQLQVVFNKINTNERVRAVVLLATGPNFSVGGDIAEYASPLSQPTLSDVCRQIENCKHPVVAGLQGNVLGGGLELALAAHHRLAGPNLKMGLPEIELGLLPAAGGTQRLPRIVGADLALDMMLENKSLNVEQARNAGLVDGIIDGHLFTGAVTLAKKLADDGGTPVPTHQKRIGFQDMAAYNSATEAAKSQYKSLHHFAHRKIIDCVEAAPLLPMEAGLILEATHFEDCRASTISQALRHMFFADRRPTHDFPRTDDSLPTIFGGGAAAISLAVAQLLSGQPARVVVETDPQVATITGATARFFDEMVDAARLSRDDRETLLSRLTVTVEANDFPAAKLWVIAETDPTPPVLDWVREIYTNCPKDVAVVSFLPIGTAQGPEDSTVSVHLNALPHSAQLAQIMTTSLTTQNAEGRANALLRSIGLSTVKTQLQTRSIIDRLNSAYFLAADILVRKGVDFVEIDRAMRRFGFRKGPFQLMDEIGLNAVLKIRKDCHPNAVLTVAADLVNKGSDGIDAGEGFYNYANTKPVVNMEVYETAAQLGASKQIQLTQATLQRLCISAMAVEGEKMLSEGVIHRPSDLDHVMVVAGYPRFRGGPMKSADLMGLLPLKTLMSKIDEPSGVWRSGALWDQAIKTADGFDVFNRALAE